MSDNSSRIARNVRLLMVTLNLKQADLAAQSGLSESQISRLLHGQRGWELKHMEAIASALGVGVADLFADADDLLRSRCVREAIRGAPEYMQQSLFAIAA